jgi:hypothetical protein
MPSITFDASRRREVEELQRQWARELPRSGDQIGGTITSSAEGPQVANTANLIVNADFVDFLRKKVFPFAEA